MAEQAKVRIDIGSKADLKGFKQVETASAKLGKSVKKLAGAFGLALGTSAIIAFGKSSVKAFIEDDNAARSLGITLKNLGLEFGNTASDVNNFISNLEKQTGVLDDELRPAMDRLLRATFSVRQSQKLLALALDISAGTGKDLTSVSQGLQKAFLGNTASLSKLGVGLSKAELTASSFDEIVVKLSTLFAGQASSAAESYAGQLNKLTVAGNNAKEVIGKGIIQALTESGGEQGFAGATKDIENYSEGISKAIVNISRFITLAREIPSFLDILKNPFGAGAAFDKYNAAFDRLESLQKSDILNKQFGQATGLSSLNKYNAAKKAADALAIKQALALTKVTKTQVAAELAKAKAKKDQAALDKAALALAKGADVFDLDKIQINAALLANQEAINKLGGAGTEQQRLGLANDLVRLTIKQDMLLLEDAIAAQDVKGATALAAKLNKDIAILGVLQGQNVKLLEINKILDAFKPKDLINLENLNTALALLMTMAGVKISPLAVGQATAQGPVFGGTAASGIPIGDFIAPIDKATASKGSIEAILEYADAATERANAFALLLEQQNAVDMAAFNNSILATASGKLGMQGDTIINISAGVIAQMDEFTAMVQRAVQAANRNGNNLDVAGVI